MKAHPALPLVLIALQTTLAPLATAEPTTREIASGVTAVTVYADRARVTRTAAIDLGGEPMSYALPALPGWVDEASVRVSLEPAAAGQILGVELRRTYLARANDDEFRAAEDAVTEIADQLAALDDEMRVLDSEAKHVESLRAFSLDKLPRDTATRRVETAEYEETVAFVGSSLRRLAEARRELIQQRRALEPELKVRQHRLEDLRQRAQLEQRTVVVSATGRGSATLAVTYMVPGATWEPAHELRAGGDADSVALTSFAHVQQTTGEDWQNAAISLATQRSDETLRIPEIEALHLGGGRSLSRWVASSRESFGAATESYAKYNAVAFALKNPSASGQRAYLENQQIMASNSSRVTEMFRALEQRGTTAHFAALGRQTVRSDGSRARIPIGNVQLQAGHRTLAAPEMSLNAVRVLELANRGEQPLLPGKVSLYVDGAFLGFTELDFIATGESFELFLGLVDHLKLARSLDRRGSELSRRGARTKLSVAFLLRVENLGDRDELVQLRDRIPVSQTDQIRVSGIKVSPEGQPDAKGLLSWSVSLAPREAREYRVEYTIEYPTKLPTTGSRDHEELRSQLESLELLMAN